ncbi:MAG: putative metal-binding motif-containing protein [Deltaproteobacteria bacterium]|nr:putative metal-binding motif-containing protein [Deltaproteobacteria bacterium]
MNHHSVSPLRVLAGLSVLLGTAQCGARTGLEVEPPPPRPPDCVTDSDCDDRLFCSGIERCIEERCVPGAPVVCDDNDRCTTDRCDETTRACTTTPRTRDEDGDGHNAIAAGAQPGSPDACGDDCDDQDRAVFPGATEVCNGRDDNCNGVIDDNATFSPAGPDVAVSEPTLAPSSVGGVAWSGTSYLASFWGYERSAAHVYFTERNRDGSATQTPPTRRLTLSEPDAYGAGVAWTGRALGIVWQDRRDGDYEIYFNRLNAQGEKLGPDQRVTFSRGFSINPSITWTGVDFVLAWQDERDTVPVPGGANRNFEIYLQRIDEQGRQIEDNVRLTRDSANSESPVVAYGGGTVGVTWLDGRGAMPNAEGNRGIFFAPLTPDLRRLGPDLRVTPQGFDAVSPVLAFNRDRWVLAWHDALASSTDHEIWGAIRSPSGAELVAPRRLTMDAGFSRYPSLVTLGDRVLMLWADDRAGSGYDVWARMYSAALEPLSTEQRVTMGSRDSVYPLATLGPDGDVGVLFRDQREGRWQVRFTRLQCALPRP